MDHLPFEEGTIPWPVGVLAFDEDALHITLEVGE
jgi:hypothetical protein